jgi:hypothetical protein
METRDVLTIVVSSVERRRLRHSLIERCELGFEERKRLKWAFLPKDQRVEFPSFQIVLIRSRL